MTTPIFAAHPIKHAAPTLDSRLAALPATVFNPIDMAELTTAMENVDDSVTYLHPGRLYAAGTDRAHRHTGPEWKLVFPIREILDRLAREGADARYTPGVFPILPLLQLTQIAFSIITVEPNQDRIYYYGIEVAPAAGTNPTNPMIQTGKTAGGAKAGANADLPADIVFDTMYVHGHPTTDRCRVGFDLANQGVTVRNSFIDEFKEVGQDSQAINIFNGGFQYTMENCFMSAAAECFLSGGANPTGRDIAVTDIYSEFNVYAKDRKWDISHPSYGGVLFSLKNMYENKNGERVLVRNCWIHDYWKVSQNDVFSLGAVDQSGIGTNTQASCIDVHVDNCMLTDVEESLASIYTGATTATVIGPARVEITNCFMENLTTTLGKLFEMNDGEDIRLEQITVFNPDDWDMLDTGMNGLMLFAGPATDTQTGELRYANNVVPGSKNGTSQSAGRSGQNCIDDLLAGDLTTYTQFQSLVYGDPTEVVSGRHTTGTIRVGDQNDLPFTNVDILDCTINSGPQQDWGCDIVTLRENVKDIRNYYPRKTPHIKTTIGVHSEDCTVSSQITSVARGETDIYYLHLAAIASDEALDGDTFSDTTDPTPNIYLIEEVNSADNPNSYGATTELRVRDCLGAGVPPSSAGASQAFIRRTYATDVLWEAALDDALIYSSGDTAIGSICETITLTSDTTFLKGSTIGLIGIILEGNPRFSHGGLTSGPVHVQANLAGNAWKKSTSVPMTFEGLHLKKAISTGTVNDRGLVEIAHSSKATFRDCLISGADHSAASGVNLAGILSTVVSTNIQVERCVIWGFRNDATATGDGINFDSGASCRVTCTTVHDCRRFGINNPNNTTSIAINNRITDCDTADYGDTWAATSRANASSDASKVGSDGATSVPSTRYINAAAEDFRIKFGTVEDGDGDNLFAVGVGTDRDRRIVRSIETRKEIPNVWQYGAYEAIPAATPTQFGVLA